MEDGQKPPLDWSLVKAYVAGVFTVTIFNRYMFLGGLIGIFTGAENICMNKIVSKVFGHHIGIYAQQQFSTNIPDVQQIWENVRETVRNSQSGKKK